MKIKLLAVGTRPPGWVRDAVQEFGKRFPKALGVEVLAVAASKHHKDVQKFMQAEAEQLLAAIAPSDWVICLDERGKEISSKGFAQALQTWQLNGRDVVLVIGGANGLAPSIKARADQTWSLSQLTLPHYLVRVLLLEALYRAWTISTGHPYHRE